MCRWGAAGERNRRLAKCRVFGDRVVPIAFVEVGSGDKVVLLKAGQRSFIAAGDTHGATGENPFGVNEVAESFLQRPLGGAMEPGSLLVGEGIQHIEGVMRLRL